MKQLLAILQSPQKVEESCNPPNLKYFEQKDHIKHKDTQEQETQTAMEIILTTSWTFEDLLTNIEELVTENNSLAQTILQLKSTANETPLEAQEYENDLKLQAKLKYLSEENDFLVKRLRYSEQRLATFLTNVTQQFVEIKGPQLEKKEEPAPEKWMSHSENNVKLVLARLRGAKSTSFLNEIKNEPLWERIDIERKLDQVPVIDEQNLQPTHFILHEEYNGLLAQLHDLQKENEELNRSHRALQAILKTTDQLKAVQHLAIDEEIALRHLVVDLQTSGNEKQLIARAYRDLAIGKFSKPDPLIH